MRRLRESIERLQASSDRYSTRLIWLTVALGLLTAVLAADVVRHWLG
jgi:predicted metal-dependent hydrolase